MVMQDQQPQLASYQTGLIQGKAHRALSRAYAEYLANHGLSMTEWGLLGLLMQTKSITSGGISTAFGVTPTMATKLVSHLAKQGLVKRRLHASDSRIKEVTITLAGRQLIRVMEPSLSQRLSELLVGISPRELASYINVVAQLANYDASAPFAA